MSLCTGSCTLDLCTHTANPPELTSPGLAEVVSSDTKDLGDTAPAEGAEGTEVGLPEPLFPCLPSGNLALILCGIPGAHGNS